MTHSLTPRARGLALLLCAPFLPAQHDERATQSLVRAYESSEHWAQKAIVLLSLGPRWHPSGSVIVQKALGDQEKRLAAFGLEALRRTDAAARPLVLVKDLVGALITKHLDSKSAFWRERVLEVLASVATDPKPSSPSAWTAWWWKEGQTYAPPPWTEPDAKSAPRASGTVSQSIVERAFDLGNAGLDVAICIDCTGSMQPTIDAARQALEEMLSTLKSLAPKLRLGVVQYRDLGDMRDGARVESPLAANVDEARDKLGKLNAGGGGDGPERVERGLALALDPAFGWKKQANKLVIVIGDAPPHAEDQERCVELARGAHEHPLSPRGGPITGGRKAEDTVRPFVVSTIAVGRAPVTEKAFKEIAAAGGGSFGRIEVQARGDNGAAVRKIVEHVLVLSFGTRFEKEMKSFLEILELYKRELPGKQG
jgi:hypothetical protein